VGIALIVIWLAFWIDAIQRFSFGTSRMWVPAWWHLGVDFLHPYLGVHAWVQGLDPYRQYIGDFRGRYAAPPVTLRLFAWVRFFDITTATVIWMVVIAVTIAYATVASVRVRRALGLWTPPLSLALGAVLWSAPVLFSIERGNLDVWVLITLFMAMNLMRRGDRTRRWYFEVLAGLVLAVGAWAKMYSGLFVIAVLPFGRWKASLACLIGIALIAVVTLDETRLFFRNAETLTENRVAAIRETKEWLQNPTFHSDPRQFDVYPFVHSLTTLWPVMFRRTPLASVPGLIGTAVVFGAAWLGVAWMIFRSPGRERLFLPFVLWTMALGTYALPISYDYNLFFLLLTVLCLWDRRDPIIVHVMMLSVLVWWQPFRIPMSPEAFTGIKLLALAPVTALLILRARELQKGAAPDRLLLDGATTTLAPPPAQAPSHERADNDKHHVPDSRRFAANHDERRRRRTPAEGSPRRRDP
jgi:hypothetical protein